MIIEKLVLKEGMDNNIDTFSPKRNLIFSSKNTRGKSTYLRLMFYALGYPIPNMKGINFGKISTEITLIEKEKQYIVSRDGDLLSLNAKGNIISYTLPSDHLAFLSYIFEYENIKVLKNLLGFIYVDQDKGWSLLNRGTVIGKIKFNIEELLSGLNNIDIDNLLEEKSKLQLDKNKYLAMLNIHELSEQVYESNGEIFISDIEKELAGQIAYCDLKIENAKRSLKEINSVILKETQFYEYIDSMHLSVHSDGVIIPVNRDTLINSTANYEYLKARRSILVTDIEKLKRERSSFEVKLNDYESKNMQTTMFNSEFENTIVDKQLATLNIDQKLVEQLLDKTSEDLKRVNASITNRVKASNPYIQKVYDYVLKYAELLGVDDKMVLKNDFIFTSDLKSMSGAVLQKMVFAFKVAFLKVIEEDMKTELFMVLDSPKGKELDDDNTELIEKLIREELHQNQVFIASIHEFENEKKIIIKERAIESRGIS
jgi:hypothetical protein